MTGVTAQHTDPETLSPQLLDAVRHLQQAVDQASRLASESGDTAHRSLGSIAADAKRVLGDLSDVRSTLLAFGQRTLRVEAESDLVQRGVAASVSAIALESGCRALEDIAVLVERARGESPAAGSALLLLPLRIAYRQGVAALSPLAALILPSRA